ncbi:MAG TPA: YceI family protein [Streptosporangiaceae bacterium]
MTTPQLGRYAIDPSRSAVRFRTRHMFGLGPVRGTFAIKSGTVDVAEPMTASGIHAEIDAASFRTSNRQRDDAVRSTRFLDTAAHPVITFTASRLEGHTLTGTLTVRGVTRPVTLTVDQVEAAADGFTARATTRIDRTEFGVTAQRGLAGRYLDLTVEARCGRS